MTHGDGTFEKMDLPTREPAGRTRRASPPAVESQTHAAQEAASPTSELLESEGQREAYPLRARPGALPPPVRFTVIPSEAKNPWYGPEEWLARHRPGRLGSSLHLLESPLKASNITTRVNQPIPAAGLTPARQAALWAANGAHRVLHRMVQDGASQ